MKQAQIPIVRYILRRAPHGARGLKRFSKRRGWREAKSRPARGAWIETLALTVAPLALMSRPARGAGIETAEGTDPLSRRRVAPRTGRGE